MTTQDSGFFAFKIISTCGPSDEPEMVDRGKVFAVEHGDPDHAKIVLATLTLATSDVIPRKRWAWMGNVAHD